MDNGAAFDAEQALGPLKEFQRRSVEHVFRRFYTDAECTRYFLLADEVGLGKTMVARGVIARALEHLWDTVERIDVVYICSNQAIAAQNVNKLNVLGKSAFELPTRMTLLPLQLSGDRGLAGNKVNFVSLTPGTTFNLRSTTGIGRERALLYHLLEGFVESRDGLSQLLRNLMGDDRWRSEVREICPDALDKQLVRSFQEHPETQASLPRLRELSERFEAVAEQDWQEIHSARCTLIGRLRQALSQACIHALEPDLVILDEFQSFSGLLHGDDAAAELARGLFEYTDEKGNETRTLLLSATPYRMLSLSGDDPGEGDHYRDFFETLGFLFGTARRDRMVPQLRRDIEQYGREMLCLPAARQQAVALKTRIEQPLTEVVARTERVGNTQQRDAMVEETRIEATVEPEDLRHAVQVAEVARILGVPSVIEYWKSAPYLLNFMREYKLKRLLKETDVASRAGLAEAVTAARESALAKKDVDSYAPLRPPNGRMRALQDDVFATDLDQRLWIPPSLPYYGGEDGPAPSKALVFSAWAMVPDAIAAVLSFEAERRAGLGELGEEGRSYFAAARLRPLQFRQSPKGRPARMRDLLLLYPSPLLAVCADPLGLYAESSDQLSYEEMRARIAARLRPHFRRLQSAADDDSTAASNGEWAAAAVLDAQQGNAAREWLERGDPFVNPGHEDAYLQHVSALRDAVRLGSVAGPAPDSGLDLLVDLALGSPAICGLRALRRVAPELALDDPGLLESASKLAWGFRTLYNHDESVALVRHARDGGDGEGYWRSALLYGARNNLQAVLDEYAHYLVEVEGLTEQAPSERVKLLAEAMHAALSLRPSHIDVDQPAVRGGGIEIDRFVMRGRFAMRLSDYKDDENTVNRLGAVRQAFNSPFRPFVLATTSIGQEGLDFHPYCHRLYHWNLPHNPVDLEQREGRVHRYKGHAIRLNVAARYGAALRGNPDARCDPWSAMFEMARQDATAQTGLEPHWIYEGPTKVERRVLMLPYSREVGRLQWLKTSLAVYRLAFGQPRQDDLLAYLQGLHGKLSKEDLDALQIRLEPPATDGSTRIGRNPP